MQLSYDAQMATQEEIARYGWIRSAVVGALLLVLAVVMGGNAESLLIPLLLGVGGVGVLIYSLVKRDRDRREVARR